MKTTGEDVGRRAGALFLACAIACLASQARAQELTVSTNLPTRSIGFGQATGNRLSLQGVNLEGTNAILRSGNRSALHTTAATMLGLTASASTLTTTPPAGLIVWWALGEGSGTTVADTSGNGHSGTLQGDPPPAWANGVTSGALDFDGYQNYVQSDQAFNETISAYTIEAWFIARSASGENPAIVSTLGDDIGFDYLGDILIWTNGYFYGNSIALNTRWDVLVANEGLVDGKWHHVAGTWDGTNSSLFVDGQLVATQADVHAAFTWTTPLRLAYRDTNGGCNYGGEIGEVRIYNRALSSDEVATDYNADTIGDGIPDWWRLKYFGSGTTTDSVSCATCDPNGNGISNLQEYQNGTNPLLPSGLTVPPDLIVWWRFDEGVGAFVGDISGNGHCGILVGDPLPAWTNGVTSGALSFDGSQNYVQSEQLFDETISAYTIEAWFAGTSAVGENPAIISTLGDDIGFDYLGDILIWTNGFFYGNAIGLNTRWDVLVANEGLLDGQWHHVAGTWDGINSSLYVDGQLVGTQPDAYDGFSWTTPLRLAYRDTNLGCNFGGNIGEVRIYNRALSSNEVAASYNTDTVGDGIPNWWRLKYFGSGTTTNADSCASCDPDGDGISNLDEYHNRTSPLDYYNAVLPVLSVASGDSQSGPPSQILTQPLVVFVTDSNGVALVNAPITFTVTIGTGQLSASTDDLPAGPLEERTDNNGTAAAYFFLPDTYDTTNQITVTAMVGTSSTQVTFNEWTGSGPIGWWKFDEGSGTNMLDSSGYGNNGIWYGEVPPIWVGGVFGSALHFIGPTGGYVLVPESGGFASVSAQLTVAAWVKTTFDGDNVLLAKFLPDGSGGSFILSLNGGRATLEMYLDGNYQALQGGSGWLQDGTWHQITGVYDGSEMRVYVDGKPDGSQDASGMIDQVAQPLLVGSNGNGAKSDACQGDIDDARIYDRALSDDEVASMYDYNGMPFDDGIPNWWKMKYGLSLTDPSVASEDPDGDGLTNLQEYQGGYFGPTDPTDYYNGRLPTLTMIGGNYQVGTTNTFAQIPLTVRVTQAFIVGVRRMFEESDDGSGMSNAPVSFAITAGAGELTTATNGVPLTTVLNLRTDARGYASAYLLLPSTFETPSEITVAAVSGTSSQTVTFLAWTLPDGPTNPVGWWRFDEGSGTTMSDSSGNGNDGTWTGPGLPTWIDGVFGKALEFDTPTNGYVTVPDQGAFAIISNQVTLSAWIRTTYDGNNVIVNKTEPDASDGSFVLSLNGGRINFELYLDGNPQSLAGRTWWHDDGTWHYVVAVYDGAEMRIYLDGALDNSQSITGRIDQVSDSLLLGSSNDGDPADACQADVDEVRLYRQALTGDDISALYNTSSMDDGIPNWWKANNGLSVTDPGVAGEDPDGDGLTNLQEYQGGTDPLDYYNGMPPTLSVVSGDGQSGTIETYLPQPLMVQVTDSYGNLLTNAPVTFAVSEGMGQIATGTNEAAVTTSVMLRTDENGLAQVFFQMPSTWIDPDQMTATAQTDDGSTQITFSEFSVEVADSRQSALYYDGGSSSYTAGPVPFASDEFTIEYWFRSSNLNCSDACAALSSDGWAIYMSQEDQTAASIGLGGLSSNPIVRSDVTDVDDGMWHHIAFVRTQGEDTRLYFDGELQAVGSLDPVATGIGQVQIGNLSIVIDEVRISNVARYSGNFVPQFDFDLDDDTVAYWKFNEGAGNASQDETGQYPLAISGSPIWVAGIRDFALSGRWTFDENSGTNAADSSGNALHGVLEGSPLPVRTSGIISNALQFDGLQNDVLVTRRDGVPPTNGLTISSWVKAPPTITGTILARQAADGSSGSYQLSLMNGHVQLGVFLEGQITVLTGTRSLQDTNWHQVAGTYDGTQMVVYVDNVMDGGQPASGMIDVVEQPLRMGMLNAQLDDVRLYHRSYQSGTGPEDYYHGTLPVVSFVSGPNECGSTNAFLSQPWTVSVTDSNGVPLTNAPVAFVVSEGTGGLAASPYGDPILSSLLLRTDTNGEAVAWSFMPGTWDTTNQIVAVVASRGSATNLEFTVRTGSAPVTITAPSAVCAHADGLTASVTDLGEGASYLWTIENGVITSGQGTSQITWQAGGDASCRLQVSIMTPSGCPDTGETILSVNPLDSWIDGPDYVCGGATNTYDAPVGDEWTYAWTVSGDGQFADGGTAESGQSVSVVAASSGYYTLRLTVTSTATGCSRSSQRTLMVDCSTVDSTGEGLPDDFAKRIVDANPNDNIQSIADVHPGDDFNGDGVSNLDEYLEGRNPVAAAVPDTGGVLRMNIYTALE